MVGGGAEMIAGTGRGRAETAAGTGGMVGGGAEMVAGTGGGC